MAGNCQDSLCFSKIDSLTNEITSGTIGVLDTGYIKQGFGKYRDFYVTDKEGRLKGILTSVMPNANANALHIAFYFQHDKLIKVWVFEAPSGGYPRSNSKYFYYLQGICKEQEFSENQITLKSYYARLAEVFRQKYLSTVLK